MTRLSRAPLVHPTARIENCTLGAWTEVAEGCHLIHASVGDYSYLMEGCMAYATTIGRFANVAAMVRMNATNHPMERATLHHFTYRSDDYWDDAGARPRLLRRPPGARGYGRSRHVARARLHPASRRHSGRRRDRRRGQRGDA